MIPTLFDAQLARDLAIDQIEKNTAEDFKLTATQIVKTVGRLRPSFTTDDIWDWFESHDIPNLAHDNRALGAVMRQLSDAGEIIPTGGYDQSRRRHCAPLRVWKLK